MTVWRCDYSNGRHRVPPQYKSPSWMVVAEGLFSSLYLEWQVGRINPQILKINFRGVLWRLRRFPQAWYLTRFWSEKVQPGLGACFLGGSPFLAKRVLIQPHRGLVSGVIGGALIDARCAPGGGEGRREEEKGEEMTNNGPQVRG